MLDDRYIVDTPENIDFAYDVAGIGSRFLAACIDSLLIIILQVVLGIALITGGEQLGGLGLSESVLVAIWATLSFAFLWGYYLIFELIWNGQSPGKRLLGLRVVREGGRPISFVNSAIRNLVRIIDFLPALYGVGVLAMFIDRRSRRLGDLAAGSLVVKERRSISLDTLMSGAEPVAVPPRPPDAPLTPMLPYLERVAPGDYELVQDFLRRRAGLAPERRAQLGGQLAAVLRARIELPPGGDPELFLEHLVREYRVAVSARQAQAEERLGREG